MNRLSKEKRDQLILAGMATVLVIAALWYLVIEAQKDALSASLKKLEDMNRKIESAQQLAKKAAKIEADFKGVKDRLDQVEADMLPLGNEYTTLFNLLKTAVAASKVEFSGDLAQPLIGETTLLPNFPYKSASFDTVFFAYYHDFGRFLVDFESKYPHIRVELVSVRLPDSARKNEPEKLRFETRIIALVRAGTTKQ